MALSGNFSLRFTDITVPVAGIPITVTRTYDTLRAHEQGKQRKQRRKQRGHPKWIDRTAVRR